MRPILMLSTTLLFMGLLTASNTFAKPHDISIPTRPLTQAALAFVEDDMTLAIGTPSPLMKEFIQVLAPYNHKIKGIIPADEAGAFLIDQYGFQVLSLENVHHIDLYVDTPDWYTSERYVIKTKSSALSREKQLAKKATTFVALVHDNQALKLQDIAIPLETQARDSLDDVMNVLHAFSEENANLISAPLSQVGRNTLQWHTSGTSDLAALEQTLNQLPGVLENGLFTQRTPDILIIHGADGIHVQ